MQAQECFDRVKDFIKSKLYEVIIELADIFIASKNGIFITIKIEEGNVLIGVVPSYSTSQEWFEGFPKFSMKEDTFPFDGTGGEFAYGGGYIPLDGTDLQLNYNNEIFMISIINENSVRRNTYNTAFGKMDKPNEYLTSGCFICGNAFFSYNPHGWSEDNHPKIKLSNSPTKFDMMVNTRIDTYDEQIKFNTQWGMTNPLRRLFKGMWDKGSSCIVSSITHEEYPIPTYRHCMWLKNKEIQRGNTVSLVQNTSLIMPINVFVKAEPVSLEYYRNIGSLNIVSYVNMYVMSSGNEVESNYNGNTYKYQCFSIGDRRPKNKDGLRGFQGLAFRRS